MTRLSLVDEPGTGENASPVLSLALQSMSYGTTPVLGAIDLALRSGETVALTGPSGIGKSTLLRIIAGLEKTFSGHLKAPSRIAFVFQEPTLLPWRSALDNLRIASQVDAEAALATLAEVGLAELSDRYPGALSLGQQRRLSLARAFAARPELLLLDEPFVSLDPELTDEMMRLFARLRSVHRVTTLMVTHVEAEAEKLASRILKLGGSPATIVSERQNAGAYVQPAPGVTSSSS